MHKLKIEFTKFTVVGAFNFALTFLVFVILLKILGIHYIISLTIAAVLGIIFTYTFNFLWVFKPEEKLHFRHRFVKYSIASLISLILNLITLRYIVESTGIDPFYVQSALIPFIVIFNFSTAKFWSLHPANKCSTSK
jgi:putative flippase GtrA